MHLAELIKQKPYEKIVYHLRRHPITFVPFILFFIFMLFVPYFLYLLVASLFPELLTHAIAYPLLVLFGSVYLLSIYLFFYVYFLDYYLDLWIVTNDRIIDVEQHGLFSRTTTELDLFHIQDVTVQMHGPIPTLFNYGNVHVKTASTNLDIVFYNVKAPNVIRENLIRLSDEDRSYHNKQA